MTGINSRPPRRGLRLIHWAPATLALGALATLAGWAASPIDLPRAVTAQKGLVASTPMSAAAQVDLANLLRLEGRIAEAEAGYRQAIELDPRSVSAHFNLGLLLQESDRVGEAQRRFRQTVDLDPRHAWAHYQIGVLEAARGRESSAVDSYARALALDPRLRFADVNPHVIDNPLIARAMLVAYRRYMAPAQPLPTYEDPSRMIGLLSSAPDEAAAASPGAAATAQGPAAGGRSELYPTSPAAGSQVAQPQTAAEQNPAGQDPAFTRELSAADIASGSRTGQVVGGGSTGSGSARQYQTPSDTRYRPAPDPVDDQGGEEPTISVPQPGFEPGVVSSGRLELRLRRDPRSAVVRDAVNG